MKEKQIDETHLTLKESLSIKFAAYGKRLGILSLFVWFIPYVGMAVSFTGLVFSLATFRYYDAKTGIKLNTFGFVFSVLTYFMGYYEGYIPTVYSTIFM